MKYFFWDYIPFCNQSLEFKLHSSTSLICRESDKIEFPPSPPTSIHPCSWSDEYSAKLTKLTIWVVRLEDVGGKQDQQQGHKKTLAIEEKDLSIQSGIYTFTEQIIKRCYRQRGTFGENAGPLEAWGSRHFFLAHKGEPRVWQDSLYGQKDIACFTTADEGITPTRSSSWRVVGY